MAGVGMDGKETNGGKVTSGNDSACIERGGMVGIERGARIGFDCLAGEARACGGDLLTPVEVRLKPWALGIEFCSLYTGALRTSGEPIFRIADARGTSSSHLAITNIMNKMKTDARMTMMAKVWPGFAMSGSLRRRIKLETVAAT